MFMQVIPTWLVTTKDFKLRVPETELDALLKIMAFNKLEFQVSNISHDHSAAFGVQTIVEASNHAACKDCPGCMDSNCPCIDCKGRCAL